MKRILSINGIGVLIAVLFFTLSCKKENTSPQNTILSNLKMLSSGYAAGAATKVEIYAAGSYFVGYNKLYIALYDSASGQSISQAQINLNTQMGMGTGASLSGPVENPTSNNAVNGIFNAAVILTSPTGNDGTFTLTVHLGGLANQKSGDFVSPVTVVQPSPAKAYSVITQDDGSNLFVSMVQPMDPVTGSNTFEITIHKEINGVFYAPDSNYTVQINPVMPSMFDMTSPNDVNPVYIGNGHYAGKVNFSMGGGWQINVNLLHNGAVSDTSHYFDMTL